MEKNGFQFKFYDDVERDIVDKTIHDIQDSIKYEIANATGLESTLEAIEKAYIQKAENEEEEDALDEVKTAIKQILDGAEVIELQPRNTQIRKLQHDLVDQYGLNSTSIGENENRRLRISK